MKCELGKLYPPKTVVKVDAWSSKHIALTILGDKMLTCIMKFHMSSDELKVLALVLLMGQVELVIAHIYKNMQEEVPLPRKLLDLRFCIV